MTGAGRGIGRAHAIALAQAGAAVVVNDHGVAIDGSGRDDAPADAVVSAIIAAGGRAMADTNDVSDCHRYNHATDGTMIVRYDYATIVATRSAS